ncbi:hypothetical protein F2Q70_00041011 [Brassica cretica]|uniref:Myb-like domain-containing protein n=1 Tax=Brassica cretica TaxID=69181 RepID=A0A8S9KBV1_BRACR|nr:hypothetical protein F2Q70_00041011 [Brassica cretica]
MAGKEKKTCEHGIICNSMWPEADPLPVIGLVGLRKIGRKTWVDGDGMKKGEWTAEEDQNLVAYINEHGVSDWRSLPKRAGIDR